MAKLSFNAKNVAPQAAFDTVPKGWYLVTITASDVVPTKKTAGGLMLSLEFTIMDGEFKGRKVFDRINTKNASAKATEIGQQQLSAICHATGVFQLTDSAELHGKPFEAKIGLEEARKAEDGTEYEARNTYKGCRIPEGGVTSGATATPGWVKPAAAAETPAPAGKKTPPASPGKKPAPPAPAAEAKVAPDEREFFVFVDPDTHEKTGDEIREMLADGMPEDTPVCLAEESENGWKTVADFGLDKPNVAEEAASAATPPPPAGKKVAPWLKKK